MQVAINGVGIAGPALAFWLQRAGHEPLLVEQAPRLREGGYVIDFWGLGYEVAGRMGALPRLLETGYAIREVRFVDGRGHRRGGFPAEVFRRLTHDRFTSLRRADVGRVLHDALDGQVETLFGDSIASIEEQGDRVRVGFDHAAPREVDLVVGADGLHSRVRSLAFGPDERFERVLGLHVAAFDVAGYRPRDELVYVSHAVPGRQVSRFAMRGDRTLFLFVFRDEHLPDGPLETDQECQEALRRAFADVGWECPAILETLDDADSFYFDRVSQIRMEHWARGRTALIGDAAAAVSLLAGEGTGLALVEAFVLAGELVRHPGDPASAFARYEQRLQPFLRAKQHAAEGFARRFVPATALGVRLRDGLSRLLSVPGLSDLLLGRSVRDDFDLPAEPA